MKNISQYTVDASASTGEWLGEPEYVGDVDPTAWSTLTDTSDIHYDTYEKTICDDLGFATLDSETRAIEIIWVK